MSEGPELEGSKALAAEHALGVLSGAEARAAQARAVRDPEFAARVQAWRERLAPLSDEVAPVEPPASAWTAIARRLPANDNTAVRRRLRFWRGATLGAMGLAAASLAVAVMIAARPPTVVEAPSRAPLLNASLMSMTADDPMFVAAYDPMRQALIVTSLVRRGGDRAHVHELWIIPADGKPHSLGMIEPGASKSMPMPKGMTRMFSPGSALAVSVEPLGGSPKKDQPSGPIAAMGMLSKI